jgi:uncharacterized protein
MGHELSVGSDQDRLLRLAGEFLDAVRQRNSTRLRSLLTPDVSWRLPGRSRISGEIQGPAAVVARAMDIAGSGVQVELLHILLGSTGFALSLHNTGETNGRRLDEHLATVCAVQGERVTAIDTYVSDLDGVERHFVQDAER